MAPLPSTASVLGRLLRLPLRCVPALTPLPILTGPLKGKRWLSTSATHGCWLGTYEIELQQLVVATLRPGDAFFDIGSNVGFFALLASTRVGGAGQVVAFEPLPRNVSLLRANLALNTVANVSIVESAVADSDGKSFFATSSSHSEYALGDEGIEVALVSLDTLWAQQRIPAPRAMKIDVEGAESRVLAGARSLIAATRPVIFLSTHGFAQHEACRVLLESFGYRFEVRRDGNHDGQYETIARPAEASGPASVAATHAS